MSEISVDRILSDHRSIRSGGQCACGKQISRYGAAENEYEKAHREHLGSVLRDHLRVDQRAAVEEDCGCGARFRIDTWHGAALGAVSEWRGSHRHAETHPTTPRARECETGDNAEESK